MGNQLAVGGRREWLWAGLAGVILYGGWLFAQAPAPEPPPPETPMAAAPMTAAPTTADPAAATPPASSGPTIQVMPLVALGVGIATVLGLIIFLKVNAFLALISAAMIVSLMADGDVATKIDRVAKAFGSSAGGIGIVIALAAVIGKCMLDSGAADRIVRAFLGIFGVDRAPIALLGSGFVLAIPVFFDTVFYLLVPLARSMYRTTGKNYLLYLLAIAAGGAITHTLVPPTPGPLLVASNLGFDVGMMIMMGLVIAAPGAVAGLIFAWILDAWMPIEMRPLGNEPEPEPLKDDELPSLWLSLLPVLLPVALISTSTILVTLADGEHAALLKPADISPASWAKLQAALATQASAAETNPGKRILAKLPPELAAKLTNPAPLSADDQAAVVAALNEHVLTDRKLFDEEAFLGVRVNKVARDLLKEDAKKLKLALTERKNRALLDSAYPKLIAEPVWDTPMREAANLSGLIGDPNLALLLSTVIAIWMVVVQRGLTTEATAAVVEESLMSAGVIILITAGGGAFGAMLTTAKVGDAIQALFQIDPGSGGLMFLVLGFLIAAVLKVAQGSTTVAMITASGMLAAVATPAILGCHPVYLACAIGSGGLIGSWMNDSGFWIFAKMGGLTETEALRSWTLLLLVLGGTSFATCLLLANFLPLV